MTLYVPRDPTPEDHTTGQLCDCDSSLVNGLAQDDVPQEFPPAAHRNAVPKHFSSGHVSDYRCNVAQAPSMHVLHRGGKSLWINRSI